MRRTICPTYNAHGSYFVVLCNGFGPGDFTHSSVLLHRHYYCTSARGWPLRMKIKGHMKPPRTHNDTITKKRKTNQSSYLERHTIKTLNVRGPSYLGLTRSISWLLMPWLLTSPGHQQPWYWLCRIGGFLSYFRKDFKYLRRINVEKWHKM